MAVLSNYLVQVCLVRLRLIVRSKWLRHAAVISPVDKIGYLGKDVHIPTGEGGLGVVAKTMWKELVGRQTGSIPSEWSIVVCDS